MIHDLKLEEITPYENNPRNNEDAIERVAESIKEFGFKVPIIIDENFVIVTGHTRYQAAKQLELETVPCITADDLTEEQIKAFRLVDNKTAEYATWDMEKLDIELEALQELEFDMGTFDFEVKEKEIEEDYFELEEAIATIGSDPITQIGDIWKLGRHRLMCGDSTKQEDAAELMDGYKAKLIITDPPYNVDYEGGTGLKIANDNMSDDKFKSFLYAAYQRMYENVMEGSPIYVFHADSEGKNFREQFTKAGFKLTQCLIWVKNSLVLGRQDYHWRHEPILYGWKEGAAPYWYGNRDKDTVFTEDKINFTKAKKSDLIEHIKQLEKKIYDNSTIVLHDKPNINELHPTMKPVNLIGKLIHNSSEKGDLILDLFGGSGSTIIAAEMSERTCYSMEFDPVYCDVIVKRWEELTGEPAEKVGK